MRIVAVSRILDEADIIEAFLRHTATFVDHHVVLDNGSRDGTLEIMKNLHNEGLNLSIYSTNSICFSERNLNNWLFNEALDNHGADWVACLDGDEFYDDSRLAGGLSSYLRDLDSSQSHVVAVQAPWFIIIIHAPTKHRKILYRDGWSIGTKITMTSRFSSANVCAM